MARFLPASVLLLAATTAHAQQLDSLLPRRTAIIVSSADSTTVSPLAGRNASVLVSSPVVGLNLPPFTTIQPVLTRVAGVQVTPYSGAPGAWSTVRIRGVANVTGSSQPLYVVDGVPAYNTDVTPEKWDGSGGNRPNPTRTPHSPSANPLLDIPVEDIATVEVVKGAAATAPPFRRHTKKVWADRRW